jgi:glycosyltransferase involved in cell wall biosynthesis
MAGSRKHLVFDARHLDGRGSGLSRYIEELAHALPGVCEARITLLSNAAIRPRRPLRGVDVVIDSGVLARLPGTVWLTAAGPSFLRRLGATHFLGTQHVLPLRRTPGVRYGLVVHDLVFHYHPETMTMSNRLLSRRFVPRSLRLADDIFTVSASTLRDLDRVYPGLRSRRCVAYPGASFQGPQESAVPRDETLRLLFVGSQEPRKNLARLIAGFLEAHRTGAALSLDIVSGAAWSSPDVQRLLSANPKGVTVHRGVSDTALGALYAGADFLVFPSLYEGFGLPVIEALDRCAIVANDIPVFRELHEFIDGIEFVDFRAPPAAIAAHLHGLRRRPVATLRRPSDRALFSWERCALTIAQGLGLV